MNIEFKRTNPGSYRAIKAGGVIVMARIERVYSQYGRKAPYWRAFDEFCLDTTWDTLTQAKAHLMRVFEHLDYCADGCGLILDTRVATTIEGIGPMCCACYQAWQERAAPAPHYCERALDGSYFLHDSAYFHPAKPGDAHGYLGHIRISGHRVAEVRSGVMDASAGEHEGKDAIVLRVLATGAEWGRLDDGSHVADAVNLLLYAAQGSDPAPTPDPAPVDFSDIPMPHVDLSVCPHGHYGTSCHHCRAAAKDAPALPACTYCGVEARRTGPAGEVLANHCDDCGKAICLTHETLTVGHLRHVCPECFVASWELRRRDPWACAFCGGTGFDNEAEFDRPCFLCHGYRVYHACAFCHNPIDSINDLAVAVDEYPDDYVHRACLLAQRDDDAEREAEHDAWVAEGEIAAEESWDWDNDSGYRLDRSEEVRGWRTVIAGAAIVGSLLFGGSASAHTTHLPSPDFPDFQLPPIGSIAYDRGCDVYYTAEDGSALAYCPEDGATYHFDPDGPAHLEDGRVVSDGPRGWYALEN